MNKKRDTLLGANKLHPAEENITGNYTELEGEDFFVIHNYEEMRPFFMTVVSSSDHWLFISSNGALSAGRRNPDNALFPYYTDDKITDSVGLTGAKTLLRVQTEQGIKLWEPFTEAYRGIYKCKSKLYKNREGNKLVFEEENLDLNLIFRYAWMFSAQFGIVKKSELINTSSSKQDIELLDGIQNIMPYGVDSGLQNERSTLVDAYKRSELDEQADLAMYNLSSMIVDKAEPSEALKATTVWSAGIEYHHILLSTLQLNQFRKTGQSHPESDIKAENGCFFIQASLELKANQSKQWAVVSEVNQSLNEIAVLRRQLSNRKVLFESLLESIAEDKQKLRRKIGLSDGIQLSNDRLSSGRHFSNVLFNIMRGGTFDDQYEVDTTDFVEHIKTMNRRTYNQFKNVLQVLPPAISYHQLRHFLLAAKHQDILRYYLEYLPLSFSRRHGDPSRPWNYFSIQIRDENNKKIRNFEGNWRDIFQNWEALAFSYPEYTLGMISKFVNASTIDGYNPYRISREGIDWEVIDPSDPWSYIGYWGDHQIIYLAKLLEISLAYHPHRLRPLLTQKIFTYANVPYRIKGYDAIASNPKDTILYDTALADSIHQKTQSIGSDGKLVWDKEGDLEQVNLTEKILVSLLAKLYNFVPEGGIWLNTQRPEWNDANNALVGNGVSMVTLYYIRRFLDFAKKLFHDMDGVQIEVNKPVIDLLESLQKGFLQHEAHLKTGFSDEVRRQFMDNFGVAGEHYRTTAYAGFTGEKRKVSVSKLLDFFALAQKYIERSIEVNKRKDGLYHAYNLVQLSEGKASLNQLYEMLEGQVAALSAKFLSAAEAVEVLDALKTSAMFRSDQYSYMLYPDRDLPLFLEKNKIPNSSLEKSKLLTTLIAEGNTSIVERDINGEYHFNGNFHNVMDLERALSRLEQNHLKKLARIEQNQVFELFEEVFNHRSFTGRSGTFYGYEGLGSIYWHMVSKLLLAIQENIVLAKESHADAGIIGRLIEHYYEIRAGIGMDKSPKLYGAFPTDAYSHTPKYAGAKQPGMTGQVKEDIINRWAELGVQVLDGRLSFKPFILRKKELLLEPATLSYYNFNGDAKKMKVREDAMAFTYCQIPIVYQLSDQVEMQVHYEDGTIAKSKSTQLSEIDSKEVFKRTGKISSLQIKYTADSFLE